MARSSSRPSGSRRRRGRQLRAGEGVGTVTRPGLPLPPGEPAINPAPRAMIRANLDEVAARLGAGADAEVEISIPGGAKIAERTANGRLGIVGGLSILGTTGVVVPYSCSAWIHSIHQRGRRRPGQRLRPCRRGDRRLSEAGRPRPLRSARPCADRDGRLRRRPAEAPARPPGRRASPSPAARRR